MKMQNKKIRILAKNEFISNDTWFTGLNNNDLIIGPSGAGKTRNYVKPNIMQCNESMIIADTKGNLVNEAGPFLEKNGYKIIHINFKNVEESDGYNPFDFIRYDNKKEKYSEQDILTLANCIIPDDKRDNDPFWRSAARMYLTSMIAYVLECLPESEHSLAYVFELFKEMPTGNFKKLYKELAELNPKSFALQTYRMFSGNETAEKMHESIRGIMAESFNGLMFAGTIEMFENHNRIDFKALGKKKTAVFLTISDTDRSMDRLISVFYTQALQVLCNSADMDYKDHRLPVPVRFILDDFATNAYIVNFDKITAVIRSREIYVSIILQSITQLNDLYGKEKAATIINNCDNCLYLGGQDIDTARFFSVKANKNINTVLNMGLNEVYLFTRGREGRKVEKYNTFEHEKFGELSEVRVRVQEIQSEECEFDARTFDC